MRLCNGELRLVKGLDLGLRGSLELRMLTRALAASQVVRGKEVIDRAVLYRPGGSIHRPRVILSF